MSQAEVTTAMTQNGQDVIEDELEIEDFEDEETSLDIAPDRRRVKTDKQDLPVDTLCQRIRKGRLNLQPEFQRNYVWNRAKASRLIESLLLDIPVPVVYVAAEPDNSWSVVDGQQRLRSVHAFVEGKFPAPDNGPFKLSGLQVLTELNGKHFKDLSDDLQNAILDSVLRIIVIEKDSHPDVKFEVFERLNLGAVKLNDQELRNCVYRGSYNRLLRELASNRYMLKIMGAEQPHTRMADRQLILRFFAMWRNTHLHYRSPMKQFLNHEIETYRHADPAELDKMRKVFEKSIEMAHTVFGPYAFHRFNPGRSNDPNGGWEKRKLNVALWDTLLYTFSFYEKHQIIPVSDAIREEFLDVLTHDTTFVEYISSTTDKPDRVQYRADIWGQRLKALVANKEPRNFSLELKQKLYDDNPTCKLCGQRIHDIDDAEVDHIKHYWRGGKTIEKNARLTHRYCNRVRGGRD